jgi:hypothetical protein
VLKPRAERVGGWGLFREARRLGGVLKAAKPVFLNEKFDFLGTKSFNFLCNTKISTYL